MDRNPDSFDDKLAILFNEMDSFPVPDSNTRSRRPGADVNVEGGPPREKQSRDDQEPGCLSFKLRWSRAESNPFLTDFIRKFQDRARFKHSK
jgi:hypothetical protein